MYSASKTVDKKYNIIKEERKVLFNDVLNTFYLWLYAPSHIQYTPVMEHWLEQELAQLVHHEVSIQGPTVP